VEATQGGDDASGAVEVAEDSGVVTKGEDMVKMRYEQMESKLANLLLRCLMRFAQSTTQGGGCDKVDASKSPYSSLSFTLWQDVWMEKLLCIPFASFPSINHSSCSVSQTSASQLPSQLKRARRLPV